MAEGATRHIDADLEALGSGARDVAAYEPAYRTLLTEITLNHDGPDRQENIERVIELARDVISILDVHPDIDHPQRRVRILMNLSVAFGRRHLGDPAWNRAQSRALLEDAIHRASQTGDLHSWAMAQRRRCASSTDGIAFERVDDNCSSGQRRGTIAGVSPRYESCWLAPRPDRSVDSG